MQLFSWSKEPTGPEIAASGDDFCKPDKKEKQMTIRYLEHVIDCKNGKLSRQKWPEKGTCVEFERVHALRSQPLIVYMDFETSNRSLREVIDNPALFSLPKSKNIFLFQLCHECTQLYKQSRGGYRARVLEQCKQEAHIQFPGGERCETCLQQLLEAVHNMGRDGACTHEKLQYTRNGVREKFALCQDCLNEVGSATVCDHSKTQLLDAMKPISWSAALVRTMGPDAEESYPTIVSEHTHLASSDDEDILPSLWAWLMSLREEILKSWQGDFPNVEDCIMTEAEKLAHATATKCYVCLRPFKDPKKREEGRRVDWRCLVGGAEVEVAERQVLKVLDHDHITRKYRGENKRYCHQVLTLAPISMFSGAACQSCNMRLEPKRPSIQVVGKSCCDYFSNTHKSLILPFSQLTINKTSMDCT